MSYYGYGHGPPHGYPSSQAYVYPTGQAYAAPTFHSTEAVEGQPAAYSHGVAEAYDYNHTAIPGLRMGFSQSTTSWPQAWPHDPSENQPEKHGSLPLQRVADPPGNPTQDVEMSDHRQLDGGADDDALEEGELSEGELEDIYEPGEVNSTGEDARSLQTSGNKPSVGRHQNFPRPLGAGSLSTDTAPVNDKSWNPEQFVRDRSGSYSPYLSPREIQSNGLENGTSHAQTPRSDIHPFAVEEVPPEHPVQPFSGNTPASQAEEIHADTVMSESKKRAQEAIIRLWPLNVRYQNYIQEGIDKTLLDELFRELGLDLAATVPAQEPPAQPTSPSLEVSKTIQDVPSHSVGPSDDVETSKITDKAKARSEERKDRIARLLAAKNTKPAAPTTDESKPAKTTAVSQATTPNDKPDKTRTQSEKSKLIQQKMEALMKAREAKATSQAQVSLPHAPSTTPDSNNIPSIAPPDTTNMDEHPGDASERTDMIAGPSIPGLFLSSNAPSPVPNQRKRPVAADLNEYSTATVQKRPFGQTRESRPFLIDVSDDEDDAEMEIDSPELRPSSIQRPVTPGSRTTSFRDHPALPDSSSHHAVSSPKTVATPTTSANGMYDLESMNKKIEDMKRKIAEAEARKKAKQSSNGTPSLSQSQTQSKEGSVDTAAEPTPIISTTPGPRATIEKSRSTTPVSHQSSPHPPMKLARVRARHPQARPPLRARVASERLPILEARRREQTEHLKHLQSEVARIEKEIQDSLAEEERLKEDVSQSESEPAPKQGEPRPNPIQAESLPVQPASDDSIATPTEKNVVPSSDEVEQDASMDESSSNDPSEAAETPKGYQDEPKQTHQAVGEEIASHDNHPLSASNSPGSTTHQPTSLDGTPRQDDQSKPTEPGDDVAMEEASSSSDEEDATEESSDGYEPTEAAIELPDPQSSPSQAPLADNAVLETNDADAKETTRTPVADGPKTSFIPYETPLQYFRAYRFHPQYKHSVPGGLRSLTYSNKIDVKREVCPDQLIEGTCPRGSECHFQHFENMQAADDQILLQLGAYGNYEGEQKQRFVVGLRELLTDFRSRKVKDFQTISEGIIEYRAKFHDDKTKILPLGGVTI
ncbi:hypothetical protein NM208_g13202 [Fusarium decemcellulare]|uniref:Uncharacterized protein n=1 Tax=Fusarium decemcellulare TaxID=57161 RepID=A0ACC1RKT8_9HYPO|nr:hypothetical protein NM208_g13202 [Fusarium decemcellulare]